MFQLGGSAKEKKAFSASRHLENHGPRELCFTSRKRVASASKFVAALRREHTPAVFHSIVCVELVAVADIYSR